MFSLQLYLLRNNSCCHQNWFFVCRDTSWKVIQQIHSLCCYPMYPLSCQESFCFCVLKELFWLHNLKYQPYLLNLFKNPPKNIGFNVKDQIICIVLTQLSFLIRFLFHLILPNLKLIKLLRPKIKNIKLTVLMLSNLTHAISIDHSFWVSQFVDGMIVRFRYYVKSSFIIWHQLNFSMFYDVFHCFLLILNNCF